MDPGGETYGRDLENGAQVACHKEGLAVVARDNIRERGTTELSDCFFSARHSIPRPRTLTRLKMESPSAQLVPDVEIDIGGSMVNVPSSPFVSEMEQSRVASNTLSVAPSEYDMAEQLVDNSFATPSSKSKKSTMFDLDEDKENVSLAESPAETAAPTPAPITPEAKSTRTPVESPSTQQRRGSADSDLMPPPPSARKTPKRTPLRPSRNAANTPRAAGSGSATSIESHTSHFHAHTLDVLSSRKVEQSSNSFQDGLDLRAAQMPAQDASNMDDTCFSAFSEIPEMTLFAKLGQSPTKTSLRTPGRETATPHTTRKRPSPSRSPSPTPRRQKTPAHANPDGTTSFLIDFTQQMDGLSNTATYRHSSPGKSEPNLLQYMNSQRSPHKSTRNSYATPSKPNNILNLLDFELPPAPTPRSIPTITVRELESLKSSYLSQISSLKATLSGREAEVESLKRAVADAERRVGEAQEQLREEKGRREDAEEAKAGWEKRGQEVENVLKSVKEEVYRSEAEKEDLHRKVEETERLVAEAETRAAKAEERFADALAARGGEEGAPATEEQVQRLVAAQIDSKIEAVSRELHSVYKDKHERKVATLKKSYEARNALKCADLQTRLMELEKVNDELIMARDATFTGERVGELRNNGEETAILKAEIEAQRAHLARVEEEMQTSRAQQEQLMRELQQERIEKGDLVAAVDEMLLLQSEQGPAKGAMSVVEDFRKSINRPSGLRAPGSMAPPESRIGGGSRIGGLGRTGSNAGKSKIMSSIEKMGRAGGHD